MIKFILPAVIIFLVVLFWEKISELVYKKLNIRINHIAAIIFFNNRNNFSTFILLIMAKEIDYKNCKLVQSDGVFIFKNINTTIGFVRFNNLGEIEYIFVNPIFRKKV